MSNNVPRLLHPIGEARRLVRASKGKRAKKRDLKRKLVEDVTPAPPADVSEPTNQDKTIALAETISVGLNSVTRQLSAVSSEAEAALAVIFLSRPKDAIIYSHLPTLCAMASTRHASQPSIRLVLLGENADARLTEALALPRAGVIGIVDGSPWQELVSLVRDRMSRVPAPSISDLPRY